MKKPELKYLVILSAFFALFSQFVACGAQLYKVSLHEDTDESQLKPISAATGSNSGATTTAGQAAFLHSIHAPNGWKEIPINFRIDPKLSSDQIAGLNSAMHTWEKIVGRKLFIFSGVHQGTSGDSFQDLYSSLDDNVNGHYLDYNWGKTGKSNLVLATTIWTYVDQKQSTINTADIHFNLNYYLIGDAFKLKAKNDLEVVDMQSLALHELGHLLGLNHVSESDDPGSIMVPQLLIGEGLTNRYVSEGDIERMQSIYGCDGDSCDKGKLYETLNSQVNKQLNSEGGESSANQYSLTH